MKHLWIGVALLSLSCGHARHDAGDGDPPGLQTTDTGVADVGFVDGCGGIDVTFTTDLPPTVLLLIDQSGSMSEKFEGGLTRWQALRDVLVGEGGVIASLQDHVRFGAWLYHSENGDLGVKECPMLVKSSIGFGNAAEIADLFAKNSPTLDTPTGAAVKAASDALTKLEDPTQGPTVIVLATDGLPDTCLRPNPDDGLEDTLYWMSLSHPPIKVIGVGNDLTADALHKMACAGAHPDGGIDAGCDAAAPIALDRAALLDAFQKGIAPFRSCKFLLDGKPIKKDAGTLTLDDKSFKYGDGWTIEEGTDDAGRSRMVLHGAACDAIHAGAAKMHLDFPCGTYLF